MEPKEAAKILLSKCFQEIVNNRFSEAKALVSSAQFERKGEADGIKIALKGIIEVASSKNLPYFMRDSKMLSVVRSGLTVRMNSRWSDDFDRSYFRTWIEFLEYWNKTRLKLIQRGQGVVQNPSE